MQLLVGLGNPGNQYQETRHNIGFRFLDALADREGLRFAAASRFRAECADWTVKGEKVMLVKPQTFMNKSGWAVQPLLHYYRIPLEHLVVIVDDLDLEVGKIRLRTEGSDGGHRGLRSIIERMGSQDFKRIRIGVGRPRPGESAVGRVLQPISDAEEEKRLADAVERAVQATEDFIRGGQFDNWSST